MWKAIRRMDGEKRIVVERGALSVIPLPLPPFGSCWPFPLFVRGQILRALVTRAKNPFQQRTRRKHIQRSHGHVSAGVTVI